MATADRERQDELQQQLKEFCNSRSTKPADLDLLGRYLQAEPASKRLVQLQQQLKEFYEAPSTTPGAIDQLERYLQARPQSAKVQAIVPEDELEERLALAEQIMAKLRGYEPSLENKYSSGREDCRWSAFQLSVIVVMPVTNLRELASESTYPFQFDEVKRWLKIFFQRTIAGHEFSAPSASRHGTTPASPSARKGKSPSSSKHGATSASPSVRKEPKSPSSSKHGAAPASSSVRKRKAAGDPDPDYVPPQKTKVGRNEEEAEKCRERDGFACILVGSATPEACHIIPFAINKTADRIPQLKAIKIVYQTFWPAENSAFMDLITSEMGSSDKSWNMLCMNHQLHFWWGKGLFALKCLGITPRLDGNSIVLIQFHWMQRRGLEDPGREINLAKGRSQSGAKAGEAKEELSQAERGNAVALSNARDFIMGPGAYYGAVSIADAVSSRTLETGRTFEIQLPAEDAPKMKIMLDFQWACILISVMSGAAGWPDFWADDDDGNYRDAFVEEWVESVSLTPSEKSADTSP